MEINVNSIINQIKKEHEVQGIPFMEGRTLATMEVGRVYTINDFGFINGESGEYVVVSTKEDDKVFYFGGMVLTQLMKDIEENYTEEQVTALMEHGFKIKIDKVKAKSSKRLYTKVEIVTE